MIRRPKLIGKSVEGAAMQAVAASRKRASTNQFKNKTISSTPKPIKQQVTRDSTLARPRLMSNADSSSNRILSISMRSLDLKEDDEVLSRVKADYGRLCDSQYEQPQRLSSLHNEGRLRLVDAWWPRSPAQSIPVSVANFLISAAPKGWNDICSFPPLPGGVEHLFIPTIAKWIVALTPGLELLSVSSTSGIANETETNSVLFCSGIKNVRGSKCFAVVRIAILKSKQIQPRVPLVRCEGWVLNLPRRSRAALKVRPKSAVKTTVMLERDAAGMDKILTDVHVSQHSHFHHFFCGLSCSNNLLFDPADSPP
jgi:hypothetical protein